MPICYTPIAPLERRSEEKYAGDYEVKQEAKYVNCGGNKGSRGNGGVNPKSLKEHRNDCANRGGDNHIDAKRKECET